MPGHLRALTNIPRSLSGKGGRYNFHGFRISQSWMHSKHSMNTLLGCVNPQEALWMRRWKEINSLVCLFHYTVISMEATAPFLMITGEM